VTRQSHDDAQADSMDNLQVMLNLSILLSTSANVSQAVDSTSCHLLPNSFFLQPSLKHSITLLLQHLTSIFANITNAPASQLNASMESQLDLSLTTILFSLLMIVIT
jgi:hypothetical protein